MDSINTALQVLSVLKATEELNKLQLRIMLELHGRLYEALVHELANVAGVSAPAISRSVDELEKLGYTKRIRDEKEDRRRVYVRLTNKGNKFIESALA
jgi:DNA-binding MarR family transcriptional regulator